MTNFIELGLSKPTVLALDAIGFTEPTEIQIKAIPVIIAGQDIMASAQTGSGKTAAYALPVIERMHQDFLAARAARAAQLAPDVANGPETEPDAQPGGYYRPHQRPSERIERKPKTLVLVPTRELCLQVAKEFERFSKHLRLRIVTVYGGASFEMQSRALRKGADIIVATPGRLLDHAERRTVDLTGVDKLILDEADRLMDMGFMPQVRKVVSQLRKQRQTLMFSATIDRRIEQIAAEYLIKPATVRANSNRIDPAEIEQRLYHVPEFGKDALLAQLIKDSQMDSVLVFTRTRRKAAWVKNRLRESNVLAEEIHGDISQSQRERTLSRYREGQFSVLVATDVASRGLDIPSISHVVNYDLPNTPAEYVHRIGRTGRAGRSGIALSFVSEDQRHLIRDIEKITGRRLDPNAPAHAPASPSKYKAAPGRRFKPSRRPRAV